MLTFEIFHLTNLSKIKITFNFNGHEGQLNYSIVKNIMVKLYQTSPSYSYDQCQQFAMSFISFSHVSTTTFSTEMIREFLIYCLSSSSGSYKYFS